MLVVFESEFQHDVLSVRVLESLGKAITRAASAVCKPMPVFNAPRDRDDCRPATAMI